MRVSAELRKNLAPETEMEMTKNAHVIVFGNEKGGTGKTTTAMHIAVALLRLGYVVSAIDLDSRQRTFARYIENRRDFAIHKGRALPLPDVQVVERVTGVPDVVAEEKARLSEALARAKENSDFLIIDTPGSDTNLSRLGHAAADTLVTPMNDSFLDFDLLAKVDQNLEVKNPSLYAEFVWDCRKRRLIASRANIDWVIMRNRVSSVEARNKRKVATAVEAVASRIGCRLASGFSERVIYRELFPLGLTMMDLPIPGLAMPLTMSHIAARQEVRELLTTLNLPGVDKAVERASGAA